jgi:hypothetical protein
MSGRWLIGDHVLSLQIGPFCAVPSEPRGGESVRTHRKGGVGMENIPRPLVGHFSGIKGRMVDGSDTLSSTGEPVGLPRPVCP